MIATILLDCNYFLKILKSNTNNEGFIAFLVDLNKLIKITKYYNGKNILIMLNNTAYYKTSNVWQTLRACSRTTFTFFPTARNSSL